MPTAWVVKIGGSLFGNDRLPELVADAAAAGAVIVPGGGPFADQVRQAQRRWRFSDGAAHAMAILAMAQFGRMLADLDGRFAVFEDPAELTSASCGPAIWLPHPNHLDKSGLPQSWDLTSDSLAAWLAGRVNATDLLLLKSLAISPGPNSAEAMTSKSWVDGEFASMIAQRNFRVWVYGAGGGRTLREGFSNPDDHFALLPSG